MPLSQTLYSKAEFANAGLQFIAGNFTFGGGTSQPDAAEGKPFAPDGTDLVRDAEGVFTLTVPGRGAIDVLAVLCSIEDASLVLQVRVSDRDDAARTIEFTTSGAADADDDPTDGAKLHVLLVLKSRQV